MVMEIKPEITPTDIAQVLSHVLFADNKELWALTDAELAAQWHFTWEADKSVSWNLYRFSDALELHKRRCRRWEEHHHGHSRVVERVRDKYLMPRIKEVESFLVAHVASSLRDTDASCL